MNAMMRRAVVGAAAVSVALGMAACGKAGGSNNASSSSSSGSSSAAAGGSKTIGLLLPDTSTTRYENADKPDFVAKVQALDPSIKVDYQNAGANAQTQAQQVQTMINQGVKVIVLDAQDSTQIKSSVQAAVAKGIKVIAYDRLAEGPVSAYVSFDNEKVGELQGQGLLAALGSKATPSAKVVEIDGDPADPNAAMFKKGFTEAVKGKIDIAYDQSGMWKPDVAAQKATAAFNQLGAKNVAAVYSANDAMAAGIVASMKTAGINVPIGGQDSQLDAIQRILAGTQSYTIYKPIKGEAEAAAQLAVDLLNGQDISSIATATSVSGSGDKVPSDLLTPILVTKANVKSTVVKDNFLPVSQICTSAYAAACKAAGLQ